MPTQKPNILFIMGDQIRWDALPVNGADWMHTPHLDRLAGSGLNFPNAFSPNPICVPARASITTGNYPHVATGSKANSGQIRDDQIKLGEHFAATGYRTYAMGKLHYVPYQDPPLLHGLETVELYESGRAKNAGVHIEDYYDYLEEVGFPNMIRAHGVGNNDVHPVPSPLPADHYVDAWVTSRTIHHLKEHLSGPGRERPFLMWTSYPKPHSPYDPPEPYHRLYDPRELPQPFGSRELLEDRDPTLRLRPDNFGWDTLSAEAIQLSRAHYYGCITFQDKQVGRLLDFLEEAELRENTIVIYTTDHGDMLGDFGIFFKANFLNGSVRIPMIVAAPGRLPQGEERQHLVGLQDILPTLATLCHCPLPETVHGEDLTPLLEEGSAAGRELFVSQCRPSPDQAYMVTDGRWKYIYTETHATEELYDQEEDPQELVNLAGHDDPKLRSIKERMKEAIVEFCRDTGDEAMLDGDGLARSEPDLEDYRKPRLSGLGDRPF